MATRLGRRRAAAGDAADAAAAAAKATRPASVGVVVA